MEPVPKGSIPSKLQHQETIHKINEGVNVSSIEGNLLRLTAFHTRFFLSSHGAEASSWIQSVLERYASTASKEWNITITPFHHAQWPQNSIIVRVEDTKAPEIVNSKENGVVIIGAHLDSVNWVDDPLLGRSPGADDDGSGILPAWKY
jgi:bacterial leucyl aminopeptidase